MRRTAVLKPLPFVEPVDVFARLAGRRNVAWLDSSLARAGDGRFSIIACDPADVFTARGDAWEVSAGQVRRCGTHDALTELDRWLDRRRVAAPVSSPPLPFYGGAIGWLSYDLARTIESIPSLLTDEVAASDIQLGWYDSALVWDHEARALWLVATDEHALENAPLAALTRRNPASVDAPGDAAAPLSPILAASDFDREAYLAAVATVRAGIARGEYYQLNLVQRFTCPHSSDPAATYLRLRAVNPAPFAAYLQTDELAVLSSSPERFLHVAADGEIRTCPIKGTRSRGNNANADAAQRDELLASAKERAELLMIVDLLRNDLGRVCVPGSVHVPRLYAVESFATVHHLVGEVCGQLRVGTTREQLLRAVFPGGSITGAPKVSAMRAIEGLERHRRGIAMGSLGYFSADGQIDFNIAIRTIVVRDQRAHVAVGAGIVWDSDPAAEYAETLAKAQALFAALGVRADTP